jgi:hypothetical protein
MSFFNIIYIFNNDYFNYIKYEFYNKNYNFNSFKINKNIINVNKIFQYKFLNIK